jgi:hypothetical protein
LNADERTRRIRIAPGVLSREVHGEAVLLHLDSGEYFGLDGVATRMWQLLSELGDLPRVESAMCEEYDIEPAAAARDVKAFVGQLMEKRLIEFAGAEAQP